MRARNRIGYWVLCGLTGMLTACGGGSGGSGGGVASIAGVAATGAGIAHAAVTAKCASGAPLTGTTDATGSYDLVLDGRTPPCMVQVSYGPPAVRLYGFASAAGRVNVTPVTDLIVAKALGSSDLDAVFAGYTSANGDSIKAGLAAAKTYVVTQVSAIAGAGIADPLSGVFSIGDADDKILDALGNALDHAGKTHADLRNVARNGGDMAAVVPAYLAAPTGLAASAASNSSIDLSWNAVPGATGYKIYRATGAGVATSGTATATATGTTYSDASLNAATTYYYKVVPSNAAVAAGTASDEASATTEPASATTTVAGFSPSSGAVGTNVTIAGTGFDADPFHMLVKFSNNVTASVVGSTATSVVVTVPAGAVTGAITVTNVTTGASATSAANFTVTGGGGGGGTWTSRASPAAWLLRGVAFGGGKFVAVGYNRTILTSTDGISWTSRSAPDSNYNDTRGVVWTGSGFVLAGDMVTGAGNIPTVATSSDGVTWTRRAWTAATDYDAVTAIGVGAGKVMLGTQNGKLAYSTDGGATWTSESQGYIAAFNGLAGNATTRVAVGRDSGYYGVILYDNGSGWTPVTGLSNFVPADVIWTGSMFLAVGSRSGGLSSAVMATSSDGVTWTRRELGTAEIPANFPLAVALAHAGALYATADNLSNKHVILKSTDNGATWTSVHEATVSGIAELAGIAASPERIVTVGGVKSVTLP